MSSLIRPEDIESKLTVIWEQLAKEKKTKASLFNLIVFNKISERTDYIRTIVQKLIGKFPCRLIFISEDTKTSTPFLKAAVDVIMSQGTDSSVACDHIDIGVSTSELERIPYVLLPHILPDLPVKLLWAEDPCEEHPLFTPLAKLAQRIIFDSESADNLLSFSKTVLKFKETSKNDIADLNWARTEGWRDLLCSIFNNDERIKELREISKITISYNDRTTESFCHLKIQSMYLLSWLASRLGWKLRQANPNLTFTFDQVAASIESKSWEKLGSGTITQVNLETVSGTTFHCNRVKDRYHYVMIQISSQEKCDLPYQFLLGQTATGQSLVKEIFIKGTSLHYLEMLNQLEELDKDKLC